MHNFFISIRTKQCAFCRHLFVFFWILSVSNTILFPTYISHSEQMRIEDVAQNRSLRSTSFLDIFLEMVFAAKTSAADAWLADTQEDNLEKDFITSRPTLLKKPEAFNPGLLPPQEDSGKEGTPLTKTTPPPKG